MRNLIVRDCLQSEHIVRVLEEQRPRATTLETIFAVFSESVVSGKFCGLVTAHDISLHPEWIFADLCNHDPALSVTPDCRIDQAIAIMDEHDRELLPVFEHDNGLLGVVTRKSVLEVLFKREQQLLTESDRLRKQLEAEHNEVLLWSNKLSELHTASRDLLASLAYTSGELDVMQSGIEALAKLVQCRYAAVGLLDGKNEFSAFVHTGLSQQQVNKIGALPQGKGLLAATFAHDAVLVIDDIRHDPRSSGFPPYHPEMKSLLALPISQQGHIYGYVYLCDKLSGASFDKNDELLTRSFAHSLSLALDNARKLEEVEKARQNLDFLAHFDALTGLPNRTLLSDRMAQAISYAKRELKSVAVLFIDLDGFKIINDSLGHQLGDQLLKQVSQRLPLCLRQEDTVTRFAGDEFVILLPEIKEPVDAATIAEKILLSMAQSFIIDEHQLFITVSIGIALYPENAQNIDKLLAHADTALYYAKSSGKNQYRFFNPEMNTSVHCYLELEKHLRTAIENDELELFYQPKIEIESGRIVGFEALLRWHSVEYGAVPPASFISLAEDSGLIIPIGEWVINTACKQAKQWLEQGFPACVSVNLSGRQFHHIGNRQNRLFEVISQALEHNGLPPELLELEITENIMMHHLNESLNTLEQLKKLGVKISIDDFGTGYSSLSYIKKFPIDTLKIDKSFIDEVVTDPNDAAIVTAIIAMAKQLQLEVVVEGIETQEQLLFFKDNEYHVVVQGYYFGRPVTAKHVSFVDYS